MVDNKLSIVVGLWRNLAKKFEATCQDIEEGLLKVAKKRKEKSTLRGYRNITLTYDTKH